VVDFPGRGVHENAIYRGGSIIPLLVSEPAAVAVGIAQGAIDHYIEILQTRHQYGPASSLRRELSMFQRDLGRATALVDTAEAALMQVAATWTRQAHDVVERGIPITDEMQRRLLMICQQNVELSPRTAICPRPAAPDRHGPERSVAPPLSPSGPRRPASTVHGHLAARAMECAV